MYSIPGKHIKKEEQASGQQQQQFTLDESAQAPTTRASTPSLSGDAVQEDSSGSSTERERPSSSRRRNKRIKSKDKGKERESGGGNEQPQQQPKHIHNRRRDSATPTPPASQMTSSSKIPSSKHSAKKETDNKRHGKKKSDPDDWSEVTDPEERRRIQNRIAQRKFREKTREQKERSERDLLNQARAGSSYQVPDPTNLPGDEAYESGVPWGGVSMRFVMAKGHESVYSNSRGGSGGSGGSAHYPSTASAMPPSSLGVDPAATISAPVQYAGFYGDAVFATAASSGRSSLPYYGSGGSISSGDDGSSRRSSSDFALLDDGQLYDDPSSFYDYYRA